MNGVIVFYNSLRFSHFYDLINKNVIYIKILWLYYKQYRLFFRHEVYSLSQIPFYHSGLWFQLTSEINNSYVLYNNGLMVQEYWYWQFGSAREKPLGACFKWKGECSSFNKEREKLYAKVAKTYSKNEWIFYPSHGLLLRFFFFCGKGLLVEHMFASDAAAISVAGILLWSLG